MDYSQLVRDAWALTWRYKFLWVLGLLAGTGGSVGSCGGSAGNGFNQPRTGEIDQPDADWGGVTGWLSDHLAVVLTIAAIAVVVIVILLILNIIATGGIARATSDLAQGQATSLGGAWRAGISLFWRFAGLVALTLVLGLIVLLVVGLLFLAGGWRAAALAGLLSLAVSVPAGIVLVYAQCTIATRGLGSVEAVRAGLELFRTRVGPSLLAWLLMTAVTLAASMAAMIAIALATLVAILIGVLLYVLLGTIVTVAYGLVIGAVAIVVLFVLVGIAGSFSWCYWMLAYLRISGQPTVTP